MLEADDNQILELRMHLGDPFLLKQLGQFAIRRGSFDLLMCWADILEFMYIPEAAIEYQISKGMHIFEKYMRARADSMIPVPISAEHREEVRGRLMRANEQQLECDHPTILPRDLFSRLQHDCLVGIYEEVFRVYKSSVSFQAAVNHIRLGMNAVTADDFDYHELLGCGTYGFVMHCVKKSTGKHYAMKVQSKKGLMQTYADCLHRVTQEKSVVATCHHPFIVSMDYAFQTASMVMMVMDLSKCGTLNDSLLDCPENQMELERVRFYAAEIFLALKHVHHLGLIYRDLKPENVLLCEDGHIKLVDMGAIVDVGGSVIGYNGPDSMMGGIFAPDYNASRAKMFDSDGFASFSQRDTVGNNSPQCKSADAAGKRYPMAELQRAQSIMGTHGFMAPEMLALQLSSVASNSTDGYTNAVDYWSLGCIIVTLLTGQKAFTNAEVMKLVVSGICGELSEVMEGIGPSVEKRRESNREEEGVCAASSSISATQQDAVAVFNSKPHLQRIGSALTNCTKVPPAACFDVIGQFLEPDEKKRLGSGKGGSRTLKKHPFFRGIQWNLLAEKRVEPPFRPPSVHSTLLPPHPNSLGGVISDLKLDFWTCQFFSAEEQQLFASWDYVCPHVIQYEMFTEEEISLHDKSRTEGSVSSGFMSSVYSASTSIYGALSVTRAGNQVTTTADGPDSKVFSSFSAPRIGIRGASISPVDLVHNGQPKENPKIIVNTLEKVRLGQISDARTYALDHK